MTIDTFYFDIEFNFQKLIFNAFNVPDKIRYKFITGSEKIEAQPNLFFKIIQTSQFHNIIRILVVA